MPLLLTTGKAAQRCSVKADTVLKWIKKGRIPAVRTAGGHYRIEEQHLVSLMPGPHPDAAPKSEVRDNLCRNLRCWEYMSSETRPKCKACLVYRMRCGCCFDLVRLVRGADHSKCFSSGLCQDCPYYRRVHGLPVNVLVVTTDETLIQNIARRANGCAAVRYARNGYEASAIISVFRPAIVVVGEVVAASEPRLIDTLANDSRIPGVRLLFGRRRGSSAAQPQNPAVVGVMERPFCCDEIVAWTGRFPVETVEDDEPATPKQEQARTVSRRAKSHPPIPA